MKPLPFLLGLLSLAFAHWDTRTAHVALQPELTDAVVRRIGLPYLTRVMLLHEAAHLVRYLYEKDRKRVIRMVAKTRRLGGGAGFRERMAAVVATQFGKQLNLLLDRSDDGFLCVAMSAGFGVTLFEYNSRQNRWNRVFARKHPAVAVGKPFSVSVQVADKGVEVRIGTEVVGTAKFPERAMDGAYGLGALSGSAGIWTAVQLESRTK